MSVRSETEENALTVDFDHEGLNDVVSDHFKVGVTNPVGNGGSGTGEEVVQDGDFVTEEHQSVDQVGTDETGTAGNENSLSLSVGQELDGRELGHGREGDRVVLFIVGRLSTVTIEKNRPQRYCRRKSTRTTHARSTLLGGASPLTTLGA